MRDTTQSIVFGPTGKVVKMQNLQPQQQQQHNGSTDNSDNSNNSKNNPLLGDHSSIPRGVIVPNHQNHVFRSKMRYRKAQKPGRAETLCGCLGSLFTLFMPVLAMTFMLAFLILLLVYDQKELQQTQMYGNEDIQDLAEIYYNSVSSDTISLVMSQYEPYREVLALACISCVLVSMVTVARNIQIEVYHKRTESIVFMKFVNYLAAIINILSYAGLMVAVNFKVTQEEPSWSVKAHFIGFLTFFGGTATYAVLHTFLLFNQSEYPHFVKLLFFVLAVIIAGSSLAFGIPIWQGGLTSDDSANPVFEWVAVFASAVSIGLYIVLFFVDPVDDELGTFFCGSCNSNSNNNNKQQSQHPRKPRYQHHQPIDVQQYQI